MTGSQRTCSTCNTICVMVRGSCSIHCYDTFYLQTLPYFAGITKELDTIEGVDSIGVPLLRDATHRCNASKRSPTQGLDSSKSRQRSASDSQQPTKCVPVPEFGIRSTSLCTKRHCGRLGSVGRLRADAQAAWAMVLAHAACKCNLFTRLA